MPQVLGWSSPTQGPGVSDTSGLSQPEAQVGGVGPLTGRGFRHSYPRGLGLFLGGLQLHWGRFSIPFQQHLGSELLSFIHLLIIQSFDKYFLSARHGLGLRGTL